MVGAVNFDERDWTPACDGRRERERLIAAGLLKPASGPNPRFRPWDFASGEPTPEVQRDAPVFRMDRIGRAEVAKEIEDRRNGLRRPPPVWMRET